MPKTPMNYSKCCIYKIEHIENESLVYVGHTTNFNKRKGEHKSNCKNENRKAFNFKLYQMLRDNGGWDRFKMIEVEKYPCKDKREAGRREDEIMTELKASINSHRASRTQNQYYEDNKGRNQEYMKQYREDNKEKIQEYTKEYNDANKKNTRI
jgi:gas vesicle protein